MDAALEDRYVRGKILNLLQKNRFLEVAAALVYQRHTDERAGRPGVWNRIFNYVNGPFLRTDEAATQKFGKARVKENKAAKAAGVIDLAQFAQRLAETRISPIKVDALAGPSATEAPTEADATAFQVIAYLIYLHNAAWLGASVGRSQAYASRFKQSFTDAYFVATSGCIAGFNTIGQGAGDASISVYLCGVDVKDEKGKTPLWQISFLRALGGAECVGEIDPASIPIVAPLELVAAMRSYRVKELRVRCEYLFPVAPLFPIKKADQLKTLRLYGHPQNEQWPLALIPPQLPVFLRSCYMINLTLASETVRRRFNPGRQTPAPEIPYKQTHSGVKKLYLSSIYRRYTAISNFPPTYASPVGRIAQAVDLGNPMLLANEVTELIRRTAPAASVVSISYMYIPSPAQVYNPDRSTSHALQFSDEGAASQYFEETNATGLFSRNEIVTTVGPLPDRYGEIGDNAGVYPAEPFGVTEWLLDPTRGFYAGYVPLLNHNSQLILHEVRLPAWIRSQVTRVRGPYTVREEDLRIEVPEKSERDKAAMLATTVELPADRPYPSPDDVGYALQWLAPDQMTEGASRLAALTVSGRHMFPPIPVPLPASMFLRPSAEDYLATLTTEDGSFRVRFRTLRKEFAGLITGPGIETDEDTGVTYVRTISSTGNRRGINIPVSNALVAPVPKLVRLRLRDMPNITEIAPDFGSTLQDLRDIQIRGCPNLDVDPDAEFFGRRLVERRGNVFSDIAPEPSEAREGVDFTRDFQLAVQRAVKRHQDSVARAQAPPQPAVAQRRRVKQERDDAIQDRKRVTGEQSPPTRHEVDTRIQLARRNLPEPFSAVVAGDDWPQEWRWARVGSKHGYAHQYMLAMYRHLFTARNDFELLVDDVVIAEDPPRQVDPPRWATNGSVNIDVGPPLELPAQFLGFSLTLVDRIVMSREAGEVVAYSCTMPVNLTGGGGLRLASDGATVLAVHPMFNTERILGRFTLEADTDYWMGEFSRLHIPLPALMQVFGGQCLSALLLGDTAISRELVQQRGLAVRAGNTNFNPRFTQPLWECRNIRDPAYRHLLPLREALWDMIISLDFTDMNRAEPHLLHGSLDNYVAMAYFCRASISHFMSGAAEAIERANVRPQVNRLLLHIDFVLRDFIFEKAARGIFFNPIPDTQAFPVAADPDREDLPASALRNPLVIDWLLFDTAEFDHAERAIYDFYVALQRRYDELGMPELGRHYRVAVPYFTAMIKLRADRVELYGAKNVRRHERRRERLFLGLDKDEDDEDDEEDDDDDGDGMEADAQEEEEVDLAAIEDPEEQYQAAYDAVMRRFNNDFAEVMAEAESRGMQVPAGKTDDFRSRLARMVAEELVQSTATYAAATSSRTADNVDPRADFEALLPAVTAAMNGELSDHVLDSLRQRRVEIPAMGPSVMQTSQIIARQEHLRAVQFPYVNLTQASLQEDGAEIIRASGQAAQQRYQVINQLMISAEGMLNRQRFAQEIGQLMRYFERSIGYLASELDELTRYIQQASAALEQMDAETRRAGRLRAMDVVDQDDDVVVAELEEEEEEEEEGLSRDAKRRKQMEALIRARFPHLLAADPCAKTIAMCAHHFGLPVDHIKSPVDGCVSKINYVDGVVTILPDDTSLQPHHLKILSDERVIPLAVGQSVFRDETTIAIIA